MKSSFRIAYLVNRYPAVSHSFIRREINAIEHAGGCVSRYSVRSPGDDLPDHRDREEALKTTILLDTGFVKLAVATGLVFFTKPIAFLRAFGAALRASAFSPRAIPRHIAYLVEACLLLRMLRVQPVDHVHAHFGTNPAMVARLLKMLGGPPYSFTVHGPDEFDRPQELDLAGKIADANLAIGISSFGQSQLMRWSDPANWQRIAVVGCGVDESFLASTDPVPVPAEPRLCCVARLSAQKGLPLLIEAAAILHRRDVDFHLTLVGDGEMRSSIEQMIADHGLDAKVSITGWCSSEDVRSHILASRAMVMASFAEGLPVVIMEALALSRPVIATAIAGTPELVDQACGWLVPAGSAISLADAMAEALSLSTAELQQRGMEGRRRVLDRHDSNKNGRQLLTLIESSHGIMPR